MKPVPIVARLIFSVRPCVVTYLISRPKLLGLPDSVDRLFLPLVERLLALPDARVRFPAACSVKALHFASMNAKPAALTARAVRRRGPPRRAFASFFQAEITLEERKKEGTKCQKDNTPLGENYCGRRSKSRGECSKLIPLRYVLRRFLTVQFPNGNNDWKKLRFDDVVDFLRGEFARLSSRDTQRAWLIAGSGRIPQGWDAALSYSPIPASYYETHEGILGATSRGR